MAKKSLPVSAQITILLVVAALMFVGGYFLMVKKPTIAKITVQETGLRVMNHNLNPPADWPGGMLYLNEPNLGIEAKLPPLKSGEEHFIPYSSFHEFFKDRSLSGIEIDTIWISDMPGFASNSFDIPEEQREVIHVNIRPE